jgi:putative ABC transport system ATP-binding protein
MEQPAAQPAPEADAAAVPAVVEAVGLRKVYEGSGSRVVALAGLDLAVPRGQFYAIMGASGSGKSTLLHVVGGLTPPTDGTLLVDGENLAAMSDKARTVFRRRRLGIVFQEYNLLPTLTARENIALPRLVDGEAAGQYRARVDELLAIVHLEQRADHRPDALSGGEQQRVAIARALLNDPAIVLADEPTGNLDSKQSAEIWTLMRRVCVENGKTILMVTHEAQGAAYADRVIVLRDGAVVGTLEPAGSGDAGLVATGYAQLVG